uniref:Uncharacterized protein n=1 Tax=Oryza nivara TaxID=4536 RepID=A0A0E0GYI2_ORYNI
MGVRWIWRRGTCHHRPWEPAAASRCRLWEAAAVAAIASPPVGSGGRKPIAAAARGAPPLPLPPLPPNLAEGRVLPAATASPPAAARYAAASVPQPHAIACHRQETAVEKEREPRERGCERERSGGEWIRTPPHHPLSVLSSLPIR